MQPEVPPSGSPDKDNLPPVTPPSAGFILKLFLIPVILVGALVACIILFFNWLGTGPQTPDEFMEGLKSSSERQRWKTAEHLAQVLKRDEQLACDVGFALRLAELLNEETQKPVPALKADEEAPPDLAAEFLPAALGTFEVPVGMPLFYTIIHKNAGSDKGTRLRRRGATWAVALLGEQMKKYDALPQKRKDQIMADLRKEAGPNPGRQTWARQALDYLKYRELRQKTLADWPTSIPLVWFAGTCRSALDRADPLQVAEMLRPCAESEDEMTRKLTVLALAMWDEPGTETLLIGLAYGYKEEDLKFFENPDETRGRREIRYNAALALARRGKPEKAETLILETLNEQKQRELYPESEGMATQTVSAGLQAVGEMKKTNPQSLQKGPIRDAVQKLADHSSNAILRAEARKVLGTDSGEDASGSGLPRHTLLIALVGGGVVLLLILAVVARWRRQTVPT